MTDEGERNLDRNQQFRTQLNNRNAEQGGFQGGLSLPEQLPQGQVDPRMLMMRNRMMQDRQMNGQMSPEANMAMKSQQELASRNRPMREATGPSFIGMEGVENSQNAPVRMPPPMPEGMNTQQMMQKPMPNRFNGQPPAQGMGQPPAQQMGQGMGTPAQMPMANTMNPNAPSARPSMGRPNMNRGQMMGRRAQMMGKQPAGSEVGVTAPRSVTPF